MNDVADYAGSAFAVDGVFREEPSDLCSHFGTIGARFAHVVDMGHERVSDLEARSRASVISEGIFEGRAYVGVFVRLVCSGEAVTQACGYLLLHGFPERYVEVLSVGGDLGKACAQVVDLELVELVAVPWNAVEQFAGMWRERGVENHFEEFVDDVRSDEWPEREHLVCMLGNDFLHLIELLFRDGLPTRQGRDVRLRGDYEAISEEVMPNPPVGIAQLGVLAHDGSFYTIDAARGEGLAGIEVFHVQRF